MVFEWFLNGFFMICRGFSNVICETDEMSKKLQINSVF